MLRRTRAKVYTAVRKHLRHLDQHPDAPDRAERISAMVASPEPLVRLVGQRIGREGADPLPLLEVLSRRYYGNRALRDIRASRMVGCTFVVADHRTAAGDGRVVTTAVDFQALPEAVKAVDEFARDGELVADVYLSWPDGPSDPDEMATRLREVLVAQQPSNRVSRITTTVAGNSGAVMHHHFTFRPVSGGLRGGAAAARAAPAHRRADAAGAAARLRPHPAALARRGGLPLPGGGPAEPVRRAARRPGRRSAT